MGTISLRLSDEDEAIIRSYAESQDKNMSSLIRETVIEKIEDEYDLKTFNHLMEQHRKNPNTITLDQMIAEVNSGE